MGTAMSSAFAQDVFTHPVYAEDGAIADSVVPSNESSGFSEESPFRYGYAYKSSSGKVYTVATLEDVPAIHRSQATPTNVSQLGKLSADAAGKTRSDQAAGLKAMGVAGFRGKYDTPLFEEADHPLFKEQIEEDKESAPAATPEDRIAAAVSKRITEAVAAIAIPREKIGAGSAPWSAPTEPFALAAPVIRKPRTENLLFGRFGVPLRYGFSGTVNGKRRWFRTEELATKAGAKDVKDVTRGRSSGSSGTPGSSPTTPTFAALREHARSLGMKGHTRLRKGDLAAAIAKHVAGGLIVSERLESFLADNDLTVAHNDGRFIVQDRETDEPVGDPADSARKAIESAKRAMDAKAKEKAKAEAKAKRSPIHLTPEEKEIGIDGRDLHSAMKEISAHDNDRVKSLQSLIETARQRTLANGKNRAAFLKAFKDGDVHTLERSRVRFDEIAHELSNSSQFRHLLDRDNPSESLFSLMRAGKPKRMTPEQIRRRAVDVVAEEHGVDRGGKIRKRSQTTEPSHGDFSVPFSRSRKRSMSVISVPYSRWRDEIIPYGFRYRNRHGNVENVGSVDELPHYIRTSGAYEETEGSTGRREDVTAQRAKANNPEHASELAASHQGKSWLSDTSVFDSENPSEIRRDMVGQLYDHAERKVQDWEHPRDEATDKTAQKVYAIFDHRSVKGLDKSKLAAGAGKMLNQFAAKVAESAKQSFPELAGKIDEQAKKTQRFIASKIVPTIQRSPSPKNPEAHANRLMGSIEESFGNTIRDGLQEKHKPEVAHVMRDVKSRFGNESEGTFRTAGNPHVAGEKAKRLLTGNANDVLTNPKKYAPGVARLLVNEAVAKGKDLAAKSPGKAKEINQAVDRYRQKIAENLKGELLASASLQKNQGSNGNPHRIASDIMSEFPKKLTEELGRIFSGKKSFARDGSPLQYGFRYRTRSGAPRVVASAEKLPKYIQKSGAYEETKGRTKKEAKPAAEAAKGKEEAAAKQPAEKPAEKQPHQMTVAELKNHASSLGMKGHSKLRKGDLLAAITKHTAGKTATSGPAAASPKFTTEQTEAAIQRAANQSKKWNGDLAFLHHAYDEFAKMPEGKGVSLDQFKNMVHDVRNSQWKRGMHADDPNRISVSRADLTSLMNPDDVRKSEHKHGTGEFHFIHGKESPAPSPAPTAEPPQKPLHSMSVAELRDVAKRRGMTVPAKIKKGDLAAAIHQDWVKQNIPAKATEQPQPAQPTPAPSAPQPPKSAAPPLPPDSNAVHRHADEIEKAFDRLDRNKRDLVHFADLRDAVPNLSKEQFDAAAKLLRKQQRFGFTTGQSQSGWTPREREATIPEVDIQHNFLSNDYPEKRVAHHVGKKATTIPYSRWRDDSIAGLCQS